MPIVDTIRTVSRKIEAREEVAKTPEFKVGDYVEVLSSEMCFTIDRVRFNHDLGRYEYHSSMMADPGWHMEACLDFASS